MNTKKYFSSLMLLLFSVGLLAQDEIIKLNGDIIQARIKEIGDEEIEYHLWINDGILYRIARKEIKGIILGSDLEREVTQVDKNVPHILRSKENGSYIITSESRQVSSFWDLKPYMELDPLAYDHYYKARNNRNFAIFFGVGSFASFGIGLFQIEKHEVDYYVQFNEGVIVGQALAYVLAPLLGISSTVLAINYNRSKQKAMDAYGIKSVAEMNLKTDLNLVEFKLGPTPNGVGLVINF